MLLKNRSKKCLEAQVGERQRNGWHKVGKLTQSPTQYGYRTVIVYTQEMEK